MASAEKLFDCTPAISSGLGDWVQIEVTDPAFCAIPLGDGDIRAVAGGVSLPVYVLARTTNRIRVTVALPGPVDVTAPVRVALTVTDGGVTDRTVSWRGWGRTHSTPPEIDAAPITVRDGVGGEITTDVFIHPNAFLVAHIQEGEPGYWMRFSTLAARAANARDVTHVISDTPFPVEKWEQPYVFISTDDLATRQEANSAINPLDPWKGGTSYHSDPCATLRSDGTLLVYYRETSSGTSLYYTPITGTCWEDATAGARVTCVGDEGGGWTAPSIVQEGDVWYLFHRTGGNVARLQSVDEGVTWTNATTAFTSTVGNAASLYERGWWHGAVSGRIDGGPHGDGYYYAYYSENWTGNANSGASKFRCWRTRSVADGRWEAARPYMHAYGSGTVYATSGWYQGCVCERSDGSMACIQSGYVGGDPTTAQVGSGPLTLSDDQVLTQRAAFEWDANGAGGQGTAYTIEGARGTVTEVAVLESKLEILKAGSGTWETLQDWTAGELTDLAVDPSAWPAGATQIRGLTRDPSDDAESPAATLAFEVPAAVAELLAGRLAVVPGMRAELRVGKELRARATVTPRMSAALTVPKLLAARAAVGVRTAAVLRVEKRLAARGVVYVSVRGALTVGGAGWLTIETLDLVPALTLDALTLLPET